MQLSLWDWPITRLRRLHRAHPRLYWRRLRDAVTAALKEGL